MSTRSEIMPPKAPNLPRFEYLNQLDGVKLLRQDIATGNENGMLKAPRKLIHYYIKIEVPLDALYISIHTLTLEAYTIDNKLKIILDQQITGKIKWLLC